MRVRTDNLDEPISRFVRRDATAFGEDATVEEALAALRREGVGEKIVYFYVTDAAGRLAGVLPTRRLLMSPPEARIGDLMLRSVIAVPAAASVLVACEYFVMHKLLAFPVVDEDRRLVGTVDIGLFADEVHELAERRQTESVFQLIGVHAARGRLASPWLSFAERFPWLLCNVAGGILCALLAGRYEAFLDSVVVLALFIPVVLALAESVSIQSVTITLQTLDVGRAGLKSFGVALLKEAAVALLLGAACGAIVGGTAWSWKGEPLIGLVIAATIAAAMLNACLLGVAIPAALRALRRDPQVAAGPIVLATADLATLLFYFNLAGLLLR